LKSFKLIQKILLILQIQIQNNFLLKQSKNMQLLKNFFLFFFLFTGTFSSCQPSEKSAQIQEKGAFQEQNEGVFTEKRHKKHRKRHKRDRNEKENSNYASENRPDANKSDIHTENVPEKALRVLKYVRENGAAMSGYVGGRRFGNFEGLLPKKDKLGERIDYQEWDVNPKIQGKNRGAERLITGSDGKGYYTGDHYGSFLLVE
jgi:ribonuclease T1